jgi:hypothetical protein
MPYDFDERLMFDPSINSMSMPSPRRCRTSTLKVAGVLVSSMRLPETIASNAAERPKMSSDLMVRISRSEYAAP